VCIAVVQAAASSSLVGKMFGLWWPITAFVTIGLEHSVANMYFFPVALFHGATVDQPHVAWDTFLLHNLVPVTIGNALGGAVLVGLVYWFVFLRGRQTTV
jgi:formate/nitrite transporter FocA (FNT family)